MAIYEITEDNITKIKETSFHEAKLKERADLQRLLKSQIEIISPDTLIIAEEFCEWDDSRRRIDLLGLDKNANLVVIELKTTQDGSHMELQAIRYAAMVSTMTFDKAVDVYGDYLLKTGVGGDPDEIIKEFLEWEEIDDDSFGQDVKIVLVSADFSKEITTAVMWLNERNLDIRCIRMKPYMYQTHVILDIQQVIPLPEAEDYQVNIREKARKEREDRIDKQSRRHLRYEFWRELLERSKGKLSLFENISPCKDSWIAAGSGRSGIHYSFDIRKHDASINFVLEGEKEKNEKAFDMLENRKEEIEKVFEGELDWRRSNELIKSYVTKQLKTGGYRSPHDSWEIVQEEMIEMMTRLEKAFSPYVPELIVR